MPWIHKVSGYTKLLRQSNSNSQRHPHLDGLADLLATSPVREWHEEQQHQQHQQWYAGVRHLER
jgi:hypothetical protein